MAGPLAMATGPRQAIPTRGLFVFSVGELIRRGIRNSGLKVSLGLQLDRKALQLGRGPRTDSHSAPHADADVPADIVANIFVHSGSEFGGPNFYCFMNADEQRRQDINFEE